MAVTLESLPDGLLDHHLKTVPVRHTDSAFALIGPYPGLLAHYRLLASHTCTASSEHKILAQTFNYFYGLYANSTRWHLW